MAVSNIWQFPLQITDRQTISMPAGAKVLTLGLDADCQVCLWAAVDPNEPKRNTEIIVVGTGHPLPHVGSYLGCVVRGPFVWHVFTGPGDAANMMRDFHFETKDNG